MRDYERRFTDRAMTALRLAQIRSKETGQLITPEHLLEGLINSMDINPGVARAALEYDGEVVEEIRQNMGYSTINKDDFDNLLRGQRVGINLSPESREVIVTAINEAKSINHDYIGTEHLLLALLNPDRLNEKARDIFKKLNITHERMVGNVQFALGQKDDLKAITTYGFLSDLVENKDFEKIDKGLKKVNVDRLTYEQIRDVLIATYDVKEDVPARNRFYEAAKNRFTQGDQDRAPESQLLEILK